MKKIITALFCMVSFSTVFASGDADIPGEYIDLGIIEVRPLEASSAPGCQVSLPFLKPEGIVVFDTLDARSIVISSFTGDGKIIRPKQLFRQKNLNYWYPEEASEYEEIQHINMRIIGRGDKEQKIKYLFYRSETGEGLFKEEYRIPFGVKELYLTYKIAIPIYDTNTSYVETLYTDWYTVRWEFNWP